MAQNICTSDLTQDAEWLCTCTFPYATLCTGCKDKHVASPGLHFIIPLPNTAVPFTALQYADLQPKVFRLISAFGQLERNFRLIDQCEGQIEASYQALLYTADQLRTEYLTHLHALKSALRTLISTAQQEISAHLMDTPTYFPPTPLLWSIWNYTGQETMENFTYRVECEENRLKEAFKVTFQTTIPGLETFNLGQIYDLITVNISLTPTHERQIQLKTCDFVHHLKQQISHLEGIPPEYQHLFHLGKELHSDFLLSTYRIKDNSFLNLSILTVISINVANQKIGLFLTFNVRENEVVRELKALIMEKEGVDIEQQVLLFQGNRMEDDEKIEKYGVKSQDFVELVIREEDEIEVNVQVKGGKDVKLYAKLGELVKELAGNIQKTAKLATVDFYLVYKGEILDKNRPLWSYNLTHKAVLRLIFGQNPRRKVKICSRNEQEISLNVPVSLPISVLKQLILKEKLLLPTTSQALFYDGKVLEDDRSIESYELQELARLRLKEKKGDMTVIVTLPANRVVTYTLEDYETVGSVKELICRYQGVPVETQKLLLEGRLLQDSEDLRDIAVTGGTHLKMTFVTLKDYEVVIKILGRQQLTYSLPDTTSIAHLKNTLWEHFEIIIPTQKLFYQNQLLEDQFSLAYYEIPAGATLYVIRDIK